MATQQLMIRLPEDLAHRLRQLVPARDRSAFVQRLIEQAIPPNEGDRLYLAALDVERDERLAAEMAEWDGTVDDNLTADPPGPHP